MPVSRSLQEVGLAVHFADRLPITIREMAAWIDEFGGLVPSIQYLPPLPPAFVPTPNAPAPTPQMSFVNLMNDSTILLPRIRLRGKDSHTLCVLQSDRVAFGWERDLPIGVDSDYPGYDVLKPRWVTEIVRFCNWLESSIGQPLLPRLVELNYNNSYPLMVGGRQRRMSEIFQFLHGDIRPVNAFAATWMELVGQVGEGAVNAQAGIGYAPPGQRVFGVNYHGLLNTGAKIGDEAALLVGQRADILHDRILDMHKAAVIIGA